MRSVLKLRKLSRIEEFNEEMNDRAEHVRSVVGRPDSKIVIHSYTLLIVDTLGDPTGNRTHTSVHFDALDAFGLKEVGQSLSVAEPIQLVY